MHVACVSMCPFIVMRLEPTLFTLTNFYLGTPRPHIRWWRRWVKVERDDKMPVFQFACVCACVRACVRTCACVYSSFAVNNIYWNSSKYNWHSSSSLSDKGLHPKYSKPHIPCVIRWSVTCLLPHEIEKAFDRFADRVALHRLFGLGIFARCLLWPGIRRVITF